MRTSTQLLADSIAQWTVCLLAGFGLLALSTNVASASIINNITLQIGDPGTDGSSSVLHNADIGTQGGNVVYKYMSGSQSGDSVNIGLSVNQLSAQFDTVTNVLTVTGTMPESFTHDQLELHDGSMVNTSSLVITGGQLYMDAGGGGYLDYAVEMDGESKTGSSTSASNAGRWRQRRLGWRNNRV